MAAALTMSNHEQDDPETTPLPAPMPGLGVTSLEQDEGEPSGRIDASKSVAMKAALAQAVAAANPSPKKLPGMVTKAATPAVGQGAVGKPATSAVTPVATPVATPAVTPAVTPATAPVVKPAVVAAPPPARSRLVPILAGLGAIAVAAAVAVVMLPGKPGAPGQTPTVAPTPPVVTPTPPVVTVPTNVPVTPVPVEPKVEPPKVAIDEPKPPATPDEPDPDDGPNTSGKPVKPGHPKTPKVAKVKEPKEPKEPKEKPGVALAPVKQLTPQIIKSTMLAAESRWKTCVKEAWGSNVTIGIVVEASGSVQKADIMGALGTSGTGRCITDQVRKLHFPPFTDGGATKQLFWTYQIPAAGPPR